MWSITVCRLFVAHSIAQLIPMGDIVDRLYCAYIYFFRATYTRHTDFPLEVLGSIRIYLIQLQHTWLVSSVFSKCPISITLFTPLIIYQTSTSSWQLHTCKHDSDYLWNIPIPLFRLSQHGQRMLTLYMVVIMHIVLGSLWLDYVYTFK